MKELRQDFVTVNNSEKLYVPPSSDILVISCPTIVGIHIINTIQTFCKSRLEPGIFEKLTAFTNGRKSPLTLP